MGNELTIITDNSNTWIVLLNRDKKNELEEKKTGLQTTKKNRRKKKGSFFFKTNR